MSDLVQRLQQRSAKVVVVGQGYVGLPVGAEVTVCDPLIAEVNTEHLEFPLVPFEPAVVGAADLVIVLVDHHEFDPAVIAEHATLVFDTKNLMRGTDFSGEVL